MEFDITNSMRASPMPSAGNLHRLDAACGSARFNITFVRVSGMWDRSVCRLYKVRPPLVDCAFIPSAQHTVTIAPGRNNCVAFPTPTMSGTPSSLLTIAACDVRPPWSVTMAEARFISGTQSGSVVVATRTAPSTKRLASRLQRARQGKQGRRCRLV